MFDATALWSPNLVTVNPTTELPEATLVAPYEHGFTEDEVKELTMLSEELDRKVIQGYEVTIEEFKTIVVPMCRINRTTEFNLKEEKPKPVKVPRVPKEKVAKVPKVKPLTKKQLKEQQTRVQMLTVKKMTGGTLTEDDIEFLKSIANNTTL